MVLNYVLNVKAGIFKEAYRDSGIHMALTQLELQ